MEPPLNDPIFDEYHGAIDMLPMFLENVNINDISEWSYFTNEQHTQSANGTNESSLETTTDRDAGGDH